MDVILQANVDHTISGQGTAGNTLDHSTTTPRVFMPDRCYTIGVQLVFCFMEQQEYDVICVCNDVIRVLIYIIYENNFSANIVSCPDH